jgi:S1-C subfamily serine protease
VIPRGAFGQAFFVTLAIAFTIAAAFVIASQQAGLQARQAGTTLIAKPDIEPSPVTSSTSIPPIEALIPLSADGIVDQVAPGVAFVLTQQGTGSGVVLREGLLVTNAHVVWPNNTVSLVFRNGATFQGRVVAIDPFADLALVDISRLAHHPDPLRLGSTDDLETGSPLWIVGYPLPAEFTPEPSVDSGEVLGITDWEFSGVRWVTVDAPAIGGQSGGAVVDVYGRVVGISTFGSRETLTSIAIDDVITKADELLAAGDGRGLMPRLIPHSGARRTLDVDLDGVWDQELFVGWLPERLEVEVVGPDEGVSLAARTIAGAEVAAGEGEVKFRPAGVFPVILAAEAQTPTETELAGSLPFIRFTDPDHGKTLERRGTTAGVYDLGGDRDYFFLDLVAGERVTVAVESAARTHLRIYGPGGLLVAEDVDESGFIRNNASVEVNAQAAGRYVVALENRLSSISGYAVVTK